MEKLSSKMGREHAFLTTTVVEDANWLVPDVRIKLGKNQKESNEEKREHQICKKLLMNVKSKAMAENDKETDQNDALMTSILTEYMESMSTKSQFQIGYPVVSYSDYYDDLAPFLRFHINNAGDPFISGNHAIHSRKFEVEVLNWFANLWEIEDADDEYWGYITNGGTEGNFHGLLLGRERFPSGILYTSTESHYSIFKAARILRMECVYVATLVNGKIDLADLNAKLLHNKDKPAIINVNIGTTFKGAVDDLDLIVETLHKCGFMEDCFHIHCDGALSGITLPFINNATKLLSFKKLPIGSISVSGHKFLGCPMPCGVQMTRKKYISKFSTNVEYLNTADATISGSRNGHSPIFLWYILNRKGYSGIKTDVTKCVANARYLTNRLRKAGISTMLNESSITVVFERPHDSEFVSKWQLACVKNMAHVVTLPNITIEVIDKFCDDFMQNRLIWYRNKMFTPPCVAPDMGDDNCCCLYHKTKSLKF